jgi:hypothetical protein
VVSAVRSASPSLFIDVSRIQGLGGRVQAPVDPAYAIQARFKHIRGVPSPGAGLPLFKLQVLDSLIDRLLALRVEGSLPADVSGLAAERLESLIVSLEGRLHESLLKSRPAFGGQFPETGLLVSLAA